MDMQQSGGIVTSSATNEELFSAYLKGDENALRILLERHGDVLTLYINGYIHDIHEAEDLMIEAFFTHDHRKATANRKRIRAISV